MVLRPLALACVVALASVPVPAAAQQVGSAIAINNIVTGTTSGKTLELTRGDGVFLDERVSAGSTSSGQFRFLDDTELAVGPGANVVLDRFVFNPDRSAKQIILNAARGVRIR